MHYSKTGLKKMIECPNCGRKNPSDWPFEYCRSCGKEGRTQLADGVYEERKLIDVKEIFKPATGPYFGGLITDPLPTKVRKLEERVKILEAFILEHSG